MSAQSEVVGTTPSPRAYGHRSVHVLGVGALVALALSLLAVLAVVVFDVGQGIPAPRAAAEVDLPAAYVPSDGTTCLEMDLCWSTDLAPVQTTAHLEAALVTLGAQSLEPPVCGMGTDDEPHACEVVGHLNGRQATFLATADLTRQDDAPVRTGTTVLLVLSGS